MKSLILPLFLLFAPLIALDIDPLVESAMEAFNTPACAVGIIIDGKIVHCKGYGADDQTLFAVGSTTKAFTCYVLDQLVSDGLLEWDRPVIDYIPEFQLFDEHATRHMTIRDLVTHRSGLPRHDWLWYRSDLNRDDFLPLLRYLEPICDLRQEMHYNNLMYVVAGIVIERITGESWEEVIHSRIFTPLGMGSSNFSVEDSKLEQNHAIPTKNGQRVDFVNICNVGPAGSINSNIHDMLLWLQHQLSLKDYEGHKLQMAKEMGGNCNIIGYGLGWVIGSYGLEKVLFHGGQIDGFICQVLMVPRKNIGIIVLTNSSSGGEWVVESLTNTLLDSYLEQEPKDWVALFKKGLDSIQKTEERKEEKPPLHPLTDYVGSYKHPAYGSIEVILNENQLYAIYHDEEISLIHHHYDIFYGTSHSMCDNLPFQFITDCSGSIHELHIACERELPAMTFKKQAVPLSSQELSVYIGTYGDETFSITVEQQKETLVVIIQGSSLELIPSGNGYFSIKGLMSYTVYFQENTIEFIQPDGTYRFTKRDDK